MVGENTSNGNFDDSWSFWHGLNLIEFANGDGDLAFDRRRYPCQPGLLAYLLGLPVVYCFAEGRINPRMGSFRLQLHSTYMT